MTLTPEQHAELNAWIDNVVMGNPARCWHRHVETVKGSLVKCTSCGETFGSTSLCMSRSLKDYTTSPADAAMVRKKCLEKGVFPVIGIHNGKYHIASRISVEAETEELCWCLFAKALFEKEAAK